MTGLVVAGVLLALLAVDPACRAARHWRDRARHRRHGQWLATQAATERHPARRAAWQTLHRLHQEDL